MENLGNFASSSHRQSANIRGARPLDLRQTIRHQNKWDDVGYCFAKAKEIQSEYETKKAKILIKSNAQGKEKHKTSATYDMRVSQLQQDMIKYYARAEELGSTRATIELLKIHAEDGNLVAIGSLFKRMVKIQTPNFQEQYQLIAPLFEGEHGDKVEQYAFEWFEHGITEYRHRPSWQRIIDILDRHDEEDADPHKYENAVKCAIFLYFSQRDGKLNGFFSDDEHRSLDTQDNYLVYLDIVNQLKIQKEAETATVISGVVSSTHDWSSVTPSDAGIVQKFFRHRKKELGKLNPFHKKRKDRAKKKMPLVTEANPDPKLEPIRTLSSRPKITQQVDAHRMFYSLLEGNSQLQMPTSEQSSHTDKNSVVSSFARSLERKIGGDCSYNCVRLDRRDYG